MSGSDCWIQITSGRGPAECQFAVARLAERVVADALKSGLKAELLESQPGEKKGTTLSVLISLKGEGASVFAQGWKGSVLWICQSPYRPSHKRKNWFVGVEVLSPADPKSNAIDQKDLRVETFRASGPGGQHVNTTDSAVRLTHGPSGIVVVASAERSQIMNRKLALARLAEKLALHAQEKEAGARKGLWAQHNSLQRGDAVRVFEGRKFRERG